MTISDMDWSIIRARVTLIETILKKILVMRCCELSPQESGTLKRHLRDTSSKPDYSTTTGPTSVDAELIVALEVVGRNFFDDLESREQEVRAREGWPLADPM